MQTLLDYMIYSIITWFIQSAITVMISSLMIINSYLIILLFFSIINAKNINFISTFVCNKSVFDEKEVLIACFKKSLGYTGFL